MMTEHREGKMEELIESVRIPLHELQADVDYLIGRVVADRSCASMIAASIKSKLAAIETGLTTPPECPGHVASEQDSKVCGRCGVHIDSLRPD